MRHGLAHKTDNFDGLTPNPMTEKKNIIIYKTPDGKSSVALFAKDGKIWLNQKSIAELFGTSKQSISRHIINILNDNELDSNAVVKDFLTTAEDGKNYNVSFYALEMILAVGYRVHGVRGKEPPQRRRNRLLSVVQRYDK